MGEGESAGVAVGVIFSELVVEIPATLPSFGAELGLGISSVETSIILFVDGR